MAGVWLPYVHCMKTKAKRSKRVPVIVTTMDTLVRLCQPEQPVLVGNDRVAHAAHYMYGAGGHDLERWHVQSPKLPTHEQAAALGIPGDAKYHSGYVKDGKQHWVYTAIRQLSPGTCPTCSANASARLFASRGLS